jgi:hypothetical protein
MIHCQTKLIKIPEVILTNALASIHLVKYSKATTVKRKLSGTVSSGLTMLTPHLCKGHVGMIDVVGLARAPCFLANIWQLSQLQTISFASSAAIGR